MPAFGKASLDKLHTCVSEIQIVFMDVIKEWDCTVVCGFRDQQNQHQAFLEGKSKLDWPNSTHNVFPSRGIDVIPYYPGGIRWTDEHGMYLFAGFVLRTAKIYGIKIRWGGDWDGDHDTKDQKFNDLCHYEYLVQA